MLSLEQIWSGGGREVFVYLYVGGNSKLFIVLVLEISKHEDQKFETFEVKKIILYIETKLSQTFLLSKIGMGMTSILQYRVS